MRCAFAALLLAMPAQGWVTKSQAMFGSQINEIQDQMKGLSVNRAVQAQLGYLWTSPEDPFSDEGLGGGITWAWDDALCDLLEPRFHEDLFIFGNYINCQDFKSAVSRAFDKWSANNKFLKFLDVTNECKKLGLNYGPPTAAAQEGQPHGGCPLAEIWVTKLVAGNRRRLSLVHNGTELIEEGASELSAEMAVATALSHARYSYDFRYTNGDKPHTLASDGVTKVFGRAVVETYAGTFSFNVEENMCWYLDSGFCYNFHKLKVSMGGATNARMMVEGTTYGLMLLAGLFFLIILLRVLNAAWNAADADGDGKVDVYERIHSVLLQLSHINPGLLALFLCLFLVPPLVVRQIFRPCFDCYDFESATLHEIGHFLGLGHPDNIPDNWIVHDIAGDIPGNNSYQLMMANGGRTNTTNCHDLWSQVYAGVPDGAALDPLSTRYPARDAQMEAVTQHNPKSCLTDDDLEALAVLYPDCGANSLSVNICHKVNHNIGLVRVMIYMAGPFLLILAFVVMLEGCMEIYEHKHIHSKKDEELKEAKRVAHRATIIAERLSKEGVPKQVSGASGGGKKRVKKPRGGGG
jgi:hypothetical protein